MGLGMNEIIEAFDGKLSRRFLLVLAVIMGITAYLYVVEFYHPNQNLVRQIWRGLGPPKIYQFYSGSEGGFYIQIGSLLEVEAKGRGRIEIRNNETKEASTTPLRS